MTRFSYDFERGRGPLRVGERGAILESWASRGVHDLRPIPRAFLNAYALFYDRLVLPVDMSAPGRNWDFKKRQQPDLAVCDDYSFLEVVESTPDYADSQTRSAAIPVGDHNETFEMFRFLEAREPGQWAIVPASALGAQIPKEEKAARRGLILDLEQCFPLPQTDCPMAELFEFKYKRIDEFEQFKQALNGLYLEIISSKDPEFTLAVKKAELAKAIAGYGRTMKERFVDISWQGVSISLGGCEAAAFGAGFSFAFNAGQGAGAAAITGLAAAAAISVRSGFSLKLKRPASAPFQYIWRINQAF
ncbi:MAG: DUF6236 family protein [Amphiplicatus sp.]